MPISCALRSTDASIAPEATNEAKSDRLNMQIFCDLDGPLIDVSKRYYKTYQLAIAEVQKSFSASLTPLSEAAFWQMKQERTPDADIAYFSGLQPEQTDLFLEKVLDIVNQPVMLEEDRLQPGVLQSLELLKRLGVSLSVVTLRCQDEALRLIKQFQLDSFFDQVCGTQDQDAAYQNYTQSKQALLQTLIDQLEDSESRQRWIIGDTEADVQAGQALGLLTVALTCGMRSQSYLERLQPTTVQADLVSATRYLLAQV